MFRIPVAITCPTLNAPANGQVSYSTFTSTYFVGTVASYSCDTGYGLNGGDVMSTCEGDGSNTNGVWDGVVPTCQCEHYTCYYWDSG